MSNLVVSNISDGSTSVGTGYVVNGSAKAWVEAVTVSSHSISGSFNVSSLIDGGTGAFDAVPSHQLWQMMIML